jgi:hypothetical protein
MMTRADWFVDGACIIAIVASLIFIYIISP